MPNVSCSWWKVKRYNGFFLNIFCSWNKIRQFFEARYFHFDKNTSNEQIFALLDDLESADKNDIDNLLNDSDTEIIAEEEIKQEAST